MPAPPFVSVVLTLASAGHSELETVIESYRSSSPDGQIEIIVSDSGPRRNAKAEAAAVALDARFNFTKAPRRNLAVAANAGLNLAAGHILVISQSDRVCAPGFLPLAIQGLGRLPASLQVATSTAAAAGGYAVVAFTRTTADKLRGYDEGLPDDYIDRDLAQRVRRSGGPVIEIAGTDNPADRPIDTTPEGPAPERPHADASTVHNLTSGNTYRGRTPLVSVVVATHNRAGFLSAALASILNQTFQDFEIVVVDDASGDATESVVNGIGDPRIRYFRLAQNSGVAAARNHGNSQARGAYIAVHDDDDIMLPDRLQKQLRSISTGFAGSYGGWIDFDAGAQSMAPHPGRTPFDMPAICFHGDILLHPTLMIRSDLARTFPYLEDLEAGSDFNLAFRLARAGIKLAHCGNYVSLRRLHDGNLSREWKTARKTASAMTRALYFGGISAAAMRALKNQSKQCLPVDIDPRDALEHALHLLSAEATQWHVEAAA